MQINEKQANKKLNCCQMIAAGFRDLILANMFQVCCSPHGLRTCMQPKPIKRDWSILLGLQEGLQTLPIPKIWYLTYRFCINMQIPVYGDYLLLYMNVFCEEPLLFGSFDHDTLRCFTPALISSSYLQA